ncbi:MAG TPA: chloride channel protein [bacterium]|nr:chloride channel protein [bacterium]
MKKKSTSWFQKLQKKALTLWQDPQHFQTLVFWISAFLASLVSVTYAGLFKMAEGFYLDLYAHHPALIWLWTPLCLLAAWALVAFLAPEASGSGIPQVLAANDLNYKTQRAWVDRLLSLKGVGIKIASSLLSSLGGTVTGREGPTIQVSAGIFHGIGRLFRRFQTRADASAWIVAGAAAGLASAFNTPLGGIVFAVEEMSVHFKRFRTVLISSIVIAGLVSQWILGSYLYLGHPDVGDVPFSSLLPALGVGLVSGAFGAFYGMCIKWLLNWRDRLKTKVQCGILALVCGLAMAALALFNPHTSGSGLEIINALLFKGEKSEWYLPFLRAAGSLVFYVSGAAGGIFAPALAAGACTGSVLASWFHSDSANLLILSGMVGFLTGVTRTPFTAFVLVVEMTDHHAAIFPIMLSALAAELVARRLDKESFYEWARKRFMPPGPSRR